MLNLSQIKNQDVTQLVFLDGIKTLVGGYIQMMPDLKKKYENDDPIQAAYLLIGVDRNDELWEMWRKGCSQMECFAWLCPELFLTSHRADDLPEIEDLVFMATMKREELECPVDDPEIFCPADDPESYPVAEVNCKHPNMNIEAGGDAESGPITYCHCPDCGYTDVAFGM